jgi:hypothetical protein
MRYKHGDAVFGRNVRYIWREPDAPEMFSSAVSLHSHTSFSHESLDFIPRVLRKVEPAWTILSALDERHRRATGAGIPYEQAYWRPPLFPLAAYNLESAGIRNRLGLNPLISLTDHDEIKACTDLRSIGIDAPCSLEWTVPYEGTVFHVGVHNIPPEDARDLQERMAEVTANPLPPLLKAVLRDLNALPRTLVVLNHPLSNEEFTGLRPHFRTLISLLRDYRQYIHALELNGLQPARNNRRTARLAAEFGMPVVSGGDRHCLEPSAAVNLTNAGTFPDFVDEVRRERVSTVLFMPEYHDHIPCRYIRFIAEAIRTYPDFAERERWVDRVFLATGSSDIPLSAMWPEGEPWPLRSFLSVVTLLASRRIQGALRLALGRPSEVGAW